MEFKITGHSAFPATPANCLDLLWPRLEQVRSLVTFTRTGEWITASAGEDPPVSMESDEREGIGRRAVLICLREVCNDAAELNFEWFAVSPLH